MGLINAIAISSKKPTGMLQRDIKVRVIMASLDILDRTNLGQWQLHGLEVLNQMRFRRNLCFCKCFSRIDVYANVISERINDSGSIFANNLEACDYILVYIKRLQRRLCYAMRNLQSSHFYVTEITCKHLNFYRPLKKEQR